MRLGLIGKNLTYSYSAMVHRELGYDYELCEIQPDELQKFVKSRAYDAFNVTIPYKKEIMQYLDELSPIARRLGAVNTVVREGERLIGYNSDYYGMEYMLDRAKIDLSGKKVLILGNGGTSNTAVELSKDKGAKEIIVVGRQGEINYSNYLMHNDSNVLINTTPVGTYPDNVSKLVDLSAFKQLDGVGEVIYNPMLTALSIEAENLGIKRSEGLVMLVAQAKYSKDFFFKHKTDNSEIERVFRNLKSRIANIALIGMPAAGKSTIGKLLSEKYNKEFVDTDALIEQKTGKSAEEIIKNKGEAAFRLIEKEVIEEVAKRNGLIIATGGGAVLNKSNSNLLRQNGVLIYIKRDVDSLTVTGRPLSKDKNALRQMYKSRNPIYKRCAHIEVMNISIEECIKEIEVRLNEYFGY